MLGAAGPGASIVSNLMLVSQVWTEGLAGLGSCLTSSQLKAVCCPHKTELSCVQRKQKGSVALFPGVWSWVIVAPKFLHLPLLCVGQEPLKV